MQNSESIFSQTDLTCLSIEQLPDGSTAIFDERSKSVHSLNPSATVVWQACASGATLPQIMAALADHFGAPVDVEVANHAIAQLQQAKLIDSGSPLAGAVPVAGAVMDMGRRSMLKGVGTLGALAVPVVLTLTGAEQRAYAAGVGSTTTTLPLVSDRRLKENLRPLATLFGLQVYAYNFIGKSAQHVGLMAQDVYQLYPEAVIVGSADPHTRPWKIDYSKLFEVLGKQQAEMLQAWLVEPITV